MFSIAEMSYYIGGRALYEEASMFVKPRDKIGLVGLNGTGKSTLLNIIYGHCKPEKGSISKSKECTIGFLNQDLLSHQTDESILTVAMGAFKNAVDIQSQIEILLHRLENEYSDKLVNRLADLQERFEQLDGYSMQARTEELLEGIGFSTANLKQPLHTFSGGWRMRVFLAKLLLEKPALLLLDEPTNHLDLPSIQWIETYLKNYSKAIIVVSHDRQFLDTVTSSTIEVTHHQLIRYEGNYSFYHKEKELRNSIQQKAYENQQKNIKQTERFIERFKAKATKARQVQSRIKALNRMDKVDEVIQELDHINFNFTFNKPTGKQVLELDRITKSYGGISVFKDTGTTITRGDKIALIGANGRGKSTLLRIIAGNEPIDNGKREIGHNVIMGFYAQHQMEVLRQENEILEELKQVGSTKTEQELRNVLGCFLFAKEDVFKKIKTLSGGEKSRVALAKTLISEANFLILDEPTNHLDFLSENILIQALQQYRGSFIVVSHNRHFISKVANKIWYIENHQIKEYPGTYEEYEYKHSQNTVQKLHDPSKKPTRKKMVTQHSNVITRPQKTDIYDLKTLQNKLKKIEKILEEEQIKKGEIEEKMTKPEFYKHTDKLAELDTALKKTEYSLQDKFNEWEKLVMEIERKKAANQ